MTFRSRRSVGSAKWTAPFSLLLFMLLVSSTLAAPTTTSELPKHKKLVAPEALAQSGSFVPGRYFLEFSRPPAANVAAQRSKRASQQSLEQDAKEQHESFDAYCRRNRIPIKVNRQFSKLWNGVSATIESADDLKKVLEAPAVVKVYPVALLSALTGEKPQAIKEPVLPQFAHKLTNMHLVRQKFPELTGKNVKVGIVDSGIDWKHPAFSIPGQKCEQFKGPGCRVLWGHDYLGDLFDARNKSSPIIPDSDPSDCDGHGTFVAGVLGGYDEKIRGVAPEVVFGIYRVLDCNGRGDGESFLRGLEQAFTDGMQLINLSFEHGHAGVDSPHARAIETLVDNGVHVIAAASNNGEYGLTYVSFPSTASKVFSVASFDNTHTFETVARLTNVPDLKTIDFAYAGFADITGRFEPGKQYKLIRSPNPPTSNNDGCDPFPADHFAGGIALVRRGSCKYSDKVVAAVAAGAIGVIVYNNRPVAMTGGYLDAAKVVTLAVGFIGGEEGVKIWNAAAAGIVTMTFNNYKARRSRTAGLPTAMSSWGLDVNLRIRPDFGAPGGDIFSAYPLNMGAYLQLSGTSFASPYVAGIVALEIQRSGASMGKDFSLAIARRLSLTARPSMMPDSTAIAESVAKTGAGLIDALAFFENQVTVTPHKLELGDTPGWPHAPLKRQVLIIKNHGNERVTYRLAHTPSRSVMGDNGRKTEEFVSLSKEYAHVTFSKTAVTLGPGEVTQVSVFINANAVVPSQLPEPGHYIFSGFVTFQSADRKSDLNVPYAVMVGDYGTMPVIPLAGPLVPVLTNGLYLNTTTEASAPTYNTSNVHEFSLDEQDDSSFPVVRFGTVFPTRKLVVSVHNAAAPGSPIVGYITSYEHASRLTNNDNGPVSLKYQSMVVTSLASTANATLPDGEYTIGLQYVRPTALRVVTNPDAALVPGWMSPKFRINRAKQSNRTP